jgi:hypothetical protein
MANTKEIWHNLADLERTLGSGCGPQEGADIKQYGTAENALHYVWN